MEWTPVGEHRLARCIVDYCVYDNLNNTYRASRRNTRRVKRQIMEQLRDVPLTRRDILIERLPVWLAKAIGPTS